SRSPTPSGHPCSTCPGRPAHPCSTSPAEHGGPVINLGVVPERLTVSLSSTGRFIAALVSNAGDWPADARIELRFTANDDDGPMVWTAVMAGARAEGDRHPDDSRQVIDGRARAVALFYQDLLWGSGQVTVVGGG